MINIRNGYNQLLFLLYLVGGTKKKIVSFRSAGNILNLLYRSIVLCIIYFTISRLLKWGTINWNIVNYTTTLHFTKYFDNKMAVNLYSGLK